MSREVEEVPPPMSFLPRLATMLFRDVHSAGPPGRSRVGTGVALSLIRSPVSDHGSGRARTQTVRVSDQRRRILRPRLPSPLDLPRLYTTTTVRDLVGLEKSPRSPAWVEFEGLEGRRTRSFQTRSGPRVKGSG